jgi:hypothetical protein
MDMLGTVQNVAMQSSHDRDGEQANSANQTGRGSRARVRQKKSETREANLSVSQQSRARRERATGGYPETTLACLAVFLLSIASQAHSSTRHTVNIEVRIQPM